MKNIINSIKKKLRKIKILQRPYSKIKVHFIMKKNQKNLHHYGYEVLGNVVNILEKNGINTFCAYGTLLGFIRDGGFIKNDSDIDMGIVSTDDFSWDRLEEVLTYIGLKKTRHFELNDNITEQSYIMNGVNIDFFLYTETEYGMTANVYWIDENRKYKFDGGHSVMYRDAPKIDKVEFIKINSINVPIPSNYEEYLVVNYGKDWRIPDPNFKPEKFVRTVKDLEAKRVDFKD